MEVDTKGEVTSDMARRLKAAQPDLVVVLAREPQLKSLFKALTDVEFTDVTVLGSNAVRNKNVAGMNIPVRALYATASAIDANEFPSGKLFLTAFADKFKSDPVWGAHYAYDAVYAVADAARRADICTQARTAVRMYQNEYESLYRYDDQGQRVVLEPAERDRRMAEQQKLVKEYCSPG